MRSERIDQQNCSTVEWDDGYFKFCDFADCAIEGKVVVSDFVSCSFKGVDWYLALFTQCNFIECRFENCTFRGCGFPDNKFVHCSLVNCAFVPNNLGGECYFEQVVAYGCSVDGGIGFNVPRGA